MTLIPASLPQLADAEIRLHLDRAISANQAINSSLLRSKCPVMVLAIRGYYRDTMGEVGKNDVGIFDDAAFIVSGGTVHRYNWNTDPSKVGWNPGVEKHFAMLAPGVWPFVVGQHKGKGPAWRQPDEEQAHDCQLDQYFGDRRANGHFGVYRARTLAGAVGAADDWGYHAINIHWGSSIGTSSWGCQTAPASQWDSFRKISYRLAAKTQPFLPYVLIDNPA